MTLGWPGHVTLGWPCHVALGWPCHVTLGWPQLAQRLDVPDHDGVIHFQETLQTIARAVHHRFKRECARAPSASPP
eukprot:5911547-Prymnesium_polylepis.1